MNWFCLVYFTLGFALVTAFCLIMRRHFHRKFIAQAHNHRTAKEILATIIDGPNHE